MPTQPLYFNILIIILLFYCRGVEIVMNKRTIWFLKRIAICPLCICTITKTLFLFTGFGRQEVVEYLLDNGAKVDVQDDGGLMPLHNACSFGHAEVVQTLLKHGADPNARDNWNFTPLHEASSKGKIDVCIGKC